MPLGKLRQKIKAILVNLVRLCLKITKDWGWDVPSWQAPPKKKIHTCSFSTITRELATF